MGRGKKIGTLRALLCSIALFAMAVPVAAQLLQPTAPAFAKVKVKKQFLPRVTAVNTTNRDKVTRLTVQIDGVPHTSGCIDEVRLKHRGKEIIATDIDGVDFKRAFQWEDDGVISVDIDFPTLEKLNPSDSLIFIMPEGRVGCAVGKPFAEN